MTPFAESAMAAREALGWTHERLAEALGASIHTYRSWLKADAVSGRQAPSWALLAVRALTTGEVVYEQRGEIEITYRAASK